VQAARSEEHGEEANIPLKQVQHSVVGRRAAARLSFQRPDVVGGQIGRTICPFLVGLTTLCLLIRQHLEDRKGRDSPVTSVVGVLVAPSKLEVLHVAHKFLRCVDADGVPVVGRGRQKLLQHGLHLNHRSPLGKEHCVDWRSPGVIICRVQSTRQANTLMLEGAEHLCFTRLVWGPSKSPASSYQGRRHRTARPDRRAHDWCRLRCRNRANLRVAQRAMLQSSTAR
jgi:hypothetical protein